MTVQGERPRERQWLRFMDTIRRDMTANEMEEKNAQDRGKWHRVIKQATH